jgi:hypothetical protein
MKEASDRVSLVLVETIFENQRALLAALKATRTPFTRLPSGDVHPMLKFAPMGSNLCFPVESFVFWVLAVACNMYKRLDRLPPVHDRKTMLEQRQYNLFKKVAKQVYVYGDDIVCRKEDYQFLLDVFPEFKLKFNSEKCCTHGSFRESCGLDAYKGIEVQPLRLKRVWSMRRKQDAVTYASYVAFSNAAYVRGYLRTAEFITQLVERDLGALPIIGLSSKVLNRPSAIEPLSALVWMRYGVSVALQPTGVRTRFKREARGNKPCYQRYEVRCLLPTTVDKTVKSDDWSMVLRRLTSPTRLDDPGIFPLAHRVNLKWAWIPLADKA